jgi:anti-sigma regulatory factor (Ser/Thr protein kinase)
MYLRSVTRSKHTIRFGSRVNSKALREFVPALYECISRGYDNIVLDFRRAERAYGDAVLPMICLVDHRRAKGTQFRVLLPEAQNLAQLFLNANWAYYLDPSHQRVDLEHRQHLAVRRFQTSPEQQAAVNAALDVVLRTMELRRDVIAALEWSLNEITDNVLNHAESPTGGLVQVSTFRDEHRIEFYVADGGRGIPNSMRTRFTHLKTDAEALGEAVKAGVTSIPDSGQGNGLAGSLRIASRANGAFRIMSGKAQLDVFKDKGGNYRTQQGQTASGFSFPGTSVMLELDTRAEFAIEDALGLDGAPRAEVTDVVDMLYSDNEGQLRLTLRDETVGFGSRHAGVELRRKIKNLLSAEPGARLVLDWAGVPLISSSFADEALGKLFVELGPVSFGARIVLAGAEPLVTSLIDRAIMQRVSQAASVGRDEASPTAL